MPIPLSNFKFADSGQSHIKRFAFNKTNGKPAEAVCVSAPVRGTPLSMMTIFPVEEINQRIWYPPMAAPLISICVLVISMVAVRSNTQRLILNARLDESAKRQFEIKANNNRLEQQI